MWETAQSVGRVEMVNLDLQNSCTCALESAQAQLTNFQGFLELLFTVWLGLGNKSI